MSPRTLSVWLAQLGGIGRSPVAPGTVATLLIGVPAAYFMNRLTVLWAAFWLLGLAGVACYVADCAERQIGRVDPNDIVIDELVGYLITMIGLPSNWATLVSGFALFRFFDIYKPWPIRLFNKETPGGLWIVLDDVAAGCYAHFVLWAIRAIWHYT